MFEVNQFVQITGGEFAGRHAQVQEVIGGGVYRVAIVQVFKANFTELNESDMQAM